MKWKDVVNTTIAKIDDLIKDDHQIWILTGQDDKLLDLSTDRFLVGFQSEYIFRNQRRVTYVVFISSFVVWVTADY